MERVKNELFKHVRKQLAAPPVMTTEPVDVEVEAMLAVKVAWPAWLDDEDSVVAPVTARVLESAVAPATFKVFPTHKAPPTPAPSKIIKSIFSSATRMIC
jgi:hypothetical protein